MATVSSLLACDGGALPRVVPLETAPVTADAPAPDTPEGVDDGPLGPGHYRGVAGLRQLEADGCPVRYTEVQGLCAHERLIAMQTRRDLRRSIAQFKAGVTPPIVADAPAPPRLTPGQMEPGALVAKGPRATPSTGAPDAAEGTADVGGDPREEPSTQPPQQEEDPTLGPGPVAIGDGPRRNFRTIRDMERVDEMDGQLRELAQHMGVLEDVQKITEDGVVTHEELEAVEKALEGSSTEVPLRKLIDVYLGRGLAGMGKP